MGTIKSNGYSVFIGKDTFKALNTFLTKNNHSSYFILCDENTLQHCLPQLITACPKLSSAEIIEIESGEASKSLEFSAHIWQTFLENKADKKSLLLNLGGGVVSDLGGFTASVYKRGMDYVNIPTSLLAMADASVGGKTAIDFRGIKNVLGTFAQPKAVFIQPDFLTSLSERHFKNGLAEIYKIALIRDKHFWGSLQTGLDITAMITRSITLKNEIVLKDPFDKGMRNVLNFGHTLGHALEALNIGTEHELLHGEAIAIGMLLESHIAYQKKFLSKKDFSVILIGLGSIFQLHSVSHLLFSDIIDQIKNDKKTLKNKFRFSLINTIGSCKFDQEVTETQIKKTFAYYHALLKKWSS